MGQKSEWLWAGLHLVTWSETIRTESEALLSPADLNIKLMIFSHHTKKYWLFYQMDIYTKSNEILTKNIEIFTKNYLNFYQFSFFLPKILKKIPNLISKKYQIYWKFYQLLIIFFTNNIYFFTKKHWIFLPNPKIVLLASQ